ncbi:MAG: hypothetical protein IT365_04470 [Candidatus Hydrogenedentes bacterium]|nr:hypothetical protein [Candidatus Hydrogenedentota bacterium]
MVHDVFFAPIILDALRSTDPLHSLQEAFQTIKDLGKIPEFHKGWAQFGDFMGEVKRELRSLASCDDDADTDSLDFLEAILSSPRHVEDLDRELVHRPDLRIRLDALRRVVTAFGPLDSSVDVVVHRRELEFVRARLVSPGESTVIPGLVPGEYRVTFSTGRLLWEGRLEEADLLIRTSSRPEPLRLAAEGVGDKSHPSRVIACHAGGIVLRTFSGLENGSLEIILEGSVQTP